MARDFKYFHKITPIVFRFCGSVLVLLLTPRGVIPKSWFPPKFCVISVLGPRDFYSQWKLLDASHRECRHLGGAVYTRWKSGSCFFWPSALGWLVHPIADCRTRWWNYPWKKCPGQFILPRGMNGKVSPHFYLHGQYRFLRYFLKSEFFETKTSSP